jgi:hypothetical protein
MCSSFFLWSEYFVIPENAFLQDKQQLRFAQQQAEVEPERTVNVDCESLVSVHLNVTTSNHLQVGVRKFAVMSAEVLSVSKSKCGVEIIVFSIAFKTSSFVLDGKVTSKVIEG